VVQVDAIDTDGDGLICPEEFYAHCRKQLCANLATFEAALAEHQDVSGVDIDLDCGRGVLEEMQLANAQTLARAFKLFEEYDTNGDGLMNRDEYWSLRYACVEL
jgi:hypothetical protein